MITLDNDNQPQPAMRTLANVILLSHRIEELSKKLSEIILAEKSQDVTDFELNQPIHVLLSNLECALLNAEGALTRISLSMIGPKLTNEAIK